MSVFSLLMPVKDVLRQNRNWLIMAAVIFLVGSLCSYLSGTYHVETLPGLEEQLDGLEQLFNLILDNPPLISALLVFLNNFITMIQMLFLGVLAGISPLVTLFANGYILGVVAASYQAMGGSIPAMIFLGILPHGIFELSAVFLCGALGLKFGFHCVATPLPEMTRRQSFKYIWKEAISVIPLVVALLLGAALIEIFITPQLFGGLM